MKSVLISLFLVLLVNTAAWSCSDSSSAICKAEDLGWVKSDMLVYGIDEGTLYETHLNSNVKNPLAKIPGKYKRTLTPSPNGRYLFFTAADDNVHGAKTKYYLYDTSNSGVRELTGIPADKSLGQLEFIGFSPDSALIAWQDNKSFDDWDKGNGVPSLLVYSTDKLERRKFDFPRSYTPSGQVRNCFTSQWGLDGRLLYSNLIDSKSSCALPKDDEHTLIYFKVDVKTGDIVKIDGGYTFGEKQFRFKNYYMDEHKRIQLAYTCGGAMDCGRLYDEPRIAGENRAYLKTREISKSGVSTKDLVVEAPGVAPAVVETGESSFCAGANIGIVSWVEKGKYLIYAFNGAFYIYGVEEKRKAQLSWLVGADYTWMPPDTIEFKFTNGSGQKDENSPMEYSPSHMY